MRTVTAALVLALGAAAAAGGCQPKHPADGTPDPQAVAADTLRGVLTVTGSEPLTTLLLTPAGDGRPVMLHGDRRLLERLTGLELEVVGRIVAGVAHTGTPDPAATSVLEVERFVVRGADGVAAVDGTVLREDGQFFLLVDGRRLHAPALPPALQAVPGARVFVAGPLDRPPVAYGIIDEAPSLGS
jgi:hypothetical protein